MFQVSFMYAPRTIQIPSPLPLNLPFLRFFASSLSPNTPTLRQRFNHLRNLHSLVAIRFCVCRIRQRIQAAKEP